MLCGPTLSPSKVRCSLSLEAGVAVRSTSASELGISSPNGRDAMELHKYNTIQLYSPSIHEIK